MCDIDWVGTEKKRAGEGEVRWRVFGTMGSELGYTDMKPPTFDRFEFECICCCINMNQ
jgi:hypothetical protein